VIGTLTVFGRGMRPWEVILAILVGIFAIVSHLSHLAIGPVMIPAVALISLILSRPRWWLPVAQVALAGGAGVAEQSLLGTAGMARSDAEVVSKASITARMVEDGPGLQYLDECCPDAQIPTCKLHEALQWSDDPYRLTASHITFETSPR